MRPERILLVSLSNIGDAVLTTPVLEGLHRRWPSAHITVLVGPRAVSLFERDPRVTQVWPYDKNMPLGALLRLVARLRWQRFDLVVDLRHSLLPLVIGARWRSPVLRQPTGGSQHRVQAHLDVVRRMGIAVDDVAPRLFVGPEDDAAVAQWLADLPPGPLVAVAPGARSHLKRWTPEGFAQVCDTLMAEQGVQVILVGDAEDRPVAGQVLGAMRQAPLDWVGRTTLRQLVALFRRVQLVLTNDSACLHLAVAAQAPVVAIFGPTDPQKYGPVCPGDRVVRLGLVCAPCERALCPYGHECMRWLPAREVLAAVRQRLAPPPVLGLEGRPLEPTSSGQTGGGVAS